MLQTGKTGRTKAPLAKGELSAQLTERPRSRQLQILCGFSANPQAPAHSDVGVDAHIDPAECTNFMEIYGEFVTSQRADVGIGPYSQIGKCQRIRRKTSASRPCPLPDLSGAPPQLPFARGAGGCPRMGLPFAKGRWLGGTPRRRGRAAGNCRFCAAFRRIRRHLRIRV